MKEIKGYIFDYGGTLDTEGNHWGKVIWHAYEDCGIKIAETHFRDAYVHAERTLGKERIIMPDFTFHKTLDTKLEIEMRFLQDNGFWNVSDEQLKEKHDEVLRHLYSGVRTTMEHSRNVLAKIRQQGKPMILVSNFYGNVETVLKEMEISTLFDAVIESAVVGIRKPDPRIFLLGVDAARLPASSIMVVGDSIDKDIIPAKSIGCMTAWFKGEPWKEEHSDATFADMIINDLDNLITKSFT